MATHTINYTDILSFKNKSKVKDHNATIKKIFDKISDIINNILDDKFVIIAFDEEVEFVDPIFFILLFDLYYEYQFTLVIDIRYMDTKSQHYIHRMLTQYSDLDGFQIYSPYIKKNEEAYKKISDIAKTDEEERARQFKILLDKKSIHLFSDVVHRKSLIYDSQYEYSLLPILKLRNFKLQKIEIFEHEDSLDPYDTRIDFYNKLSLYQAKQNVEKYRVNLHDKIEKLLNAVGLENRGLSVSFRDIFFELIDNIRKHTPESTSAHISFRKDQKSYLYELIIADNNPKGFINTYRETLSKEQERLKKSGVKEELLKNYTDVIRDIDEKNYKKVLTGLFQIQKNGAKNSKTEEMHIHQIPRIAMHFGLPLLVKLLEKISQQKSKTTPELKLFLHNQDKYFEITYKFNDGSSTLHINDNSKHKKVGTYIIITFPENVKIDIDLNSDDKELTSINRDNDEYNQFIDNQDKISSQINEFSFYLDKHLERDLNINLEYTYAPKDKYIFVKYTGKYTFSEFIRTIYLYAYKYDIEDIVVFNVPLFNNQDNSENIEHLRLLESIMYGNLKVPYEKSLNILFYSDREPEAILIGGRNQKEYCYLNQLLPSWYETHNKNSICIDNHEPSVKLLSSKLFIELNKKTYLLPFELFEISDEDRRNGTTEKDRVSILEGMLEKYLNEVAKIDGIHIDTGRGYHIDRFIEFKKVFEDSRWVKRLAFRLALEINSLWQQKREATIKYQLFGTDKYTHMLISLSYAYLNGHKNQLKYKLFNIYDNYDRENLKSEISKCESGIPIILISSVIFNGEKIKKIKEDFKHKKIKSISAIQLVLRDQKDSIKQTNLITVQNRGHYWKIQSNSFCSKCQNTSRQTPLLEFTKEDPLFIKDTFFGKVPIKYLESYMEQKGILANWFDSLHFGHIERGSNHFLYYINTVKFFNQNIENISKYLKVTKDKIQAREIISKLGTIKEWSKSDRYNLLDYRYYKLYKESEKKTHDIIILTSSHDTNNNFIALVNKIVFNNDATVLSFDRSKAEANFHDLGSHKINWEKTKVYFVDDSIASGYTLEYFYQLLRFMPTIMDTQSAGLNGVITMIDRMSSYDESLLCSYLKNDNQIFKKSQDRLLHKLQNIHTFASFDIKPIKTEIEECFLCKRKDRYLNLARNSALDLTTFQMAKKYLKLRNTEYHKIDSARDKPRHDRFKIYLKAMATDYVHREYIKHSKGENTYLFDDFEKIHDDFSQKMFESFEQYKRHWIISYGEKLLTKIIKFQSEIALLKAMSFPKLSYYYNVRAMALKIINKKLQKIFNSTTKKEDIEHFVLNHIFKDDIDNIKNIKNLTAEDLKFLNYYEKTTLFHHANTYFAILGYFRETKVLDEQVIRFFYRISQFRDKIEDKNKDTNLLHTYPFAVKFAIDNNLEKSNYFESNLRAVMRDNQGNLHQKQFAYLNALHLENTIWKKEDLKHSYQIDFKQVIHKLYNDTEPPEEKFKTLKNDLFEKVFPDSEVKLFVSPYIDLKSSDYSDYLDKSENSLVDILNEYRSINSYEIDMRESVKKIFYGAENTTKDTDTNIVLTKLSKAKIYTKIDDTWSNEFQQKKGFVVVRLTSIDEDQLKKQKDIKQNKPVWFKPIGCIVVKNKKGDVDHSFHLKVTRIILTIKKYLIGYLDREFSHGVIQGEIKRKKELHLRKLETQLKVSLNKQQAQMEVKKISDDLIDKENALKITKNELQNLYLSLQDISHTYKDYISIQESLTELENGLNQHKIIQLTKGYTLGLSYIFKIASLKTDGIRTKARSKNITYMFKQGTLKTKLESFLHAAPYFIQKSSTPSSQFNLIVQCNKDFKIKANDKNKIEAVFFELIFNAIKQNIWRKQTCNIYIELNQNNIFIKNDGIEIPSGKLEKIFQESVSFLSSSPTTRSGLGLGLPYIRKYLKSISLNIKALEPDKPYTVVFKISKGEIK